MVLNIWFNSQKDSSSLCISYSGPEDRHINVFILLIKQIAAWTADIAAQNPSLVSRSVIGETYEGRPLYLLKVSAVIHLCQTVFLLLSMQDYDAY